MKWLASALVAASFLSTPPTHAAQSAAPTRLELLDRWIGAVHTHQPGQRDPAVELIAGMPRSDREAFTQVAMNFSWMLTHSDDPTRRGMPRQAPAERAELLRLSRSELGILGANDWLHRAAVLHADAALLAGDLTDEANRAQALPASTDRRAAKPAQLYWADDGAYRATSEPNWNLEFGRTLLDDVQPSPRADAFTGAWYHAVSAYLIGKAWLGVARPHIDRALTLRPDDPWLVFDNATLVEALGLAQAQAFAATAKLPGGVRLEVPSAGASESQAIDLYKRALTLAPTLVEARVRYGRVLSQRGRFAEAVTELQRAISDTRDTELLYFAHLFAARAEQGLNHDAEAVAHCRSAVALFPQAQSAQVALSFALLRSGDAPGAAELISAIRLLPTEENRRDPWWMYDLGAGRHVNEILISLWKQLR